MVLRGGADFCDEVFREKPELFCDEIDSDSAWDLINWPKSNPDPVENNKLIRLYEKLKLKAGNEKRLHDEHLFLQMELRCREETERSFFAKLGSRFFRWLSDYGWSVTRPLSLIFYSNSIGTIYFDLAGFNPRTALALSFSNQVSFFGFNRTLIGIDLTDLTSWAKLVIATQSIIGAVLIFCLLLALRNRLRMR